MLNKFMYGNNAIFPRFGFGSALHGSGLKVNVCRGECQQFRDTPPGIDEDQDGVNPRFPGVFPQPGHFFSGEHRPGRGRGRCAGE